MLELAGFRGLGQQALHQVDELLLGLGDVPTSMQERREFGAVVLAVVGDQRVRLEHRFEPRASLAWSVSEFGETFEVAGDVTLVPGDQDGFDVWEVLVQRRTSDAGFSWRAAGPPCRRRRTRPRSATARAAR